MMLNKLTILRRLLRANVTLSRCSISQRDVSRANVSSLYEQRDKH